MTAVVLDGKACAAEVEAEVSAQVAELAEAGVHPHLAVVIVGDDPASHIYVSGKERACARVGIRSTRIDLPADTDFSRVVSTVGELNANDDVHGILVQSPLPKGMDELAVTDLIDPAKDVDGFHPSNLGRIVQGRVDGMVPCTPAGIVHLLNWGGVELSGKRAVVIGRSRIVGTPVSLLLARKGVDSTVSVAHSRTADLAGLCRQADILVAAVARPRFVKGDWIKPGAVIVDAGSHPEKCGDVDLDEAAPRSSAYTPVPGGVGPMTISMLIQQTVRAAERTTGID